MVKIIWVRCMNKIVSTFFLFRKRRKTFTGRKCKIVFFIYLRLQCYANFNNAFSMLFLLVFSPMFFFSISSQTASGYSWSKINCNLFENNLSFSPTKFETLILRCFVQWKRLFLPKNVFPFAIPCPSKWMEMTRLLFFDFIIIFPPPFLSNIELRTKQLFIWIMHTNVLCVFRLSSSIFFSFLFFNFFVWTWTIWISSFVSSIVRLA